MNVKGLLCLAAALWLASPQEARRLDAAAVKVETIEDGAIGRGETALTIVDGDDKGVLRYDAVKKELRFAATRGNRSPGTSPLPASRRMELLRPLLARLFQQFGTQQTYTFGIAGYREVNGRLVAAAARSSNWDPVSGQPRSGTLAGFVIGLLDADGLFSELTAVFGEFKYAIRATAVENILVSSVKDLERVDAAGLPSGSAPDSKFPSSASIYYSVTEGRDRVRHPLSGRDRPSRSVGRLDVRP